MPSLGLQRTPSLKDFPSGSSINYKAGKLYLIGDDANEVLILDVNYRQLDSLRIFDLPEKRIPKPAKADTEASTLIEIKGEEFLCVIGSASTENRKVVILIPLLPSGLFNKNTPVQVMDDKVFIERLLKAGIPEINIEGLTIMKDKMIMGNRGNRTHTSSHLIFTEKEFWNRQTACSVVLSELMLPEKNKGLSGVSGLCCVESKDLLLFIASSETTGNSYEDGAIGDSYLCWINTISRKIHQPAIRADGIINLSDYNESFRREKIEGLCVENINGDALALHLVSDNDKGESKLFDASLFL